MVGSVAKAAGNLIDVSGFSEKTVQEAPRYFVTNLFRHQYEPVAYAGHV